MRLSVRSAARLRTADRTPRRWWITAASCGAFWAAASPIVGLVLFLVWKDTKPRTAKAAGIGALVCVIAYVLLYVLAAVAGIGAALVY